MTLEVDPIAKGRPRFTRTGHAYTPLRTREYEQGVSWLAKQIWTQPALTGGLYVNVTFYLPVKDRKLWGKPHTKRPDLDNLVKSLDALNGIVWEDDSQIAGLLARKIYSEKGRIILEVSENVL